MKIKTTTQKQNRPIDTNIDIDMSCNSKQKIERTKLIYSRETKQDSHKTNKEKEKQKQRRNQKEKNKPNQRKLN